MTQFDNDTIADATYTIRRPGCAAWTQGVRADKVLTELAEANDHVAGHIVIGETGAVEGSEVATEQFETLEY